ncbi:exodeoxyribonuclease III [uncultured Actinomyces sp.]|uniref:exodeoxyribonuclease III n=1 Tax=uncultured Actinomyces sp. TaxID=249061 RepID=UPI002639937E|nr:exodeoxyribonuclease III [uncultured Actinomyces sp.]
MRLATWNVNSVRTRTERVIRFLERQDIDVLAIQETKCRPEQFPYLPFEAAGYEVAVHGLDQWNGVAIASRVGLSDVVTSFPGQPTWVAGQGKEPVVEARALGATVGGALGTTGTTGVARIGGGAGISGGAGGTGPAGDATATGVPRPVRLWSLYVPNGRELTHPHYTYKLEWLARLRDAVGSWLEADPDLPLALVGDWNVAPRDEDVWDMSAFAGATHVSAPEREAFAAFESVGMSEVTRPHVTNYTFWDYQRLRFPRNEGMRIDFAYASPALAARVVGAAIDRDERKGKGASDHVPVIIELD